jgi:DMSO/TMAO reductase YedYZ molybdopterin-dependent catalytic subunit
MPRPNVWHLMLALLALCSSAEIAAQAAGSITTTLTVGGNVSQSLSLTVADLKRYPAHQIDYVPPQTEHNSGSEPARQYTGCLLRDVLAAAKPTEGKARDLRRSYVVASASDGYEVVFSWAELFISAVGDNVYVVYERDGTPLADDEGRIALVVLTDLRPARHVKWLSTLMLRTA